MCIHRRSGPINCNGTCFPTIHKTVMASVELGLLIFDEDSLDRKIVASLDYSKDLRLIRIDCKQELSAFSTLFRIFCYFLFLSNLYAKHLLLYFTNTIYLNSNQIIIQKVFSTFLPLYLED